MAQPDYTFWKAALAGQKPAMSPDSPELGFYRMRSKNRSTGAVSWKPVAYYLDDGKIMCSVGDMLVDEHRGQEIWTHCGQHPVEEAAWRAVAERDGNWPDMDETVASQTTPGIGDNSQVDEAELLADQINSAAAGKKEYVKVTSVDQQARGQSLRSRLLELAGQAKKIHKKLKDPHWEKCKELDAKWLTLVKVAEDAAKEIKKSNDDYSTELLKAQRKAEAEAAVAAQAAIQEAEMADPEIAPAPAIAQMPTQTKGAYGRAAGVKPEWVLTAITSQGMVYEHFKNSAAVQEVLRDLAAKAIKRGEAVPGTLSEERASSR